MIKLDTKNTGVKHKNLDREITKLKKKKEALFLEPWKQDISGLLAFAHKAQKKYQDIVIIGIGGSILGAKTLFETLKHPYWNLIKKPRMFFVDNLDANPILDLGDVINKEKTLFVVVSKSGETLEIMEIVKFLIPALKKKFGNKWNERVIAVTEENEGKLHKLALKENLKMFLIPKEISGRFSVFTNAGLLPAALCGINIEKLLEGTKKIKLSDIPAKLAYAQYKANKPISVIFPYSSGFSAFCEWYKQLLAESLGKKGKGITPVAAIGPKDQHSLLQLFLDGPKDKFILFIETTGKYIEFSKVIAAEKKATERTLKQKNATVILPKMDEEHLGQLLFTLECQVALMGELYGINAFSQPGVEKVKKLTKKILGQN